MREIAEQVAPSAGKMLDNLRRCFHLWLIIDFFALTFLKLWDRSNSDLLILHFSFQNNLVQKCEMKSPLLSLCVIHCSSVWVEIQETVKMHVLKTFACVSLLDHQPWAFFPSLKQKFSLLFIDVTRHYNESKLMKKSRWKSPKLKTNYSSCNA